MWTRVSAVGSYRGVTVLNGGILSSLSFLRVRRKSNLYLGILIYLLSSTT